MHKIFAAATLSLLLAGSAHAESNLAANGTDLTLNIKDIKAVDPVFSFVSGS